MGPMGSGHSPSRHELCPWDDENSLPCKMMSKNNFGMTQLLCGHPAAKWIIQDFCSFTFGFLCNNCICICICICICLVSVLIFTHKSRPECLRNIIMFVRNPNVSGEKSLKTHFAAGSRKEAGLCQKYFQHIFACPGDIVHALMDCVATMGPIH